MEKVCIVQGVDELDGETKAGHERGWRRARRSRWVARARGRGGGHARRRDVVRADAAVCRGGRR